MSEGNESAAAGWLVIMAVAVLLFGAPLALAMLGMQHAKREGR